MKKRRRKKYDGHEVHPGSELTTEQIEFGKAIERYKERHGIRYLSWSEVLDVLKAMGYRKCK